MDLHIKIPPIPSKKGVKEAEGSDLWQNHTELILTPFFGRHRGHFILL